MRTINVQALTGEAFLVPKGTFVKLNPLIVHGTQYLTEEGEAHILCLLPGRTFRNDMISQVCTPKGKNFVHPNKRLTPSWLCRYLRSIS